MNEFAKFKEFKDEIELNIERLNKDLQDVECKLNVIEKRLRTLAALTDEGTKSSCCSVHAGGYEECVSSEQPVGSLLEIPHGRQEHAVEGYMKCDGSRLKKTDYPELYDAIGVSWGGYEPGEFKIPCIPHHIIKTHSILTKECDHELSGDFK